MYARVCKECRKKITEKQVLLYKELMVASSLSDDELDIWTIAVKIRDKLCHSKQLINQHLPKV